MTHDTPWIIESSQDLIGRAPTNPRSRILRPFCRNYLPAHTREVALLGNCYVYQVVVFDVAAQHRVARLVGENCFPIPDIRHGPVWVDFD